MPPRILALGHDAFRAGAQIAFLHVLRWLREHHSSELSLALRGGGDLFDEYAAVLPTQVLPSRTPPTSSSRVVGAARRARHRVETHSAQLAPGSYDLVYANSLVTAPLAVALAEEAGCPVVCHAHELEMTLRRSVDPDELQAVTGRLDRVIAVSQAVERNLVDGHGIDPARIDRIPEGIRLPVPEVEAVAAARLSAALGIPEGAFVVGGSGTADWRKGPDLFLLIASAVQRLDAGRPVHFVWVGGERGALELVQHDLDRLGLGARVTFVGEQADPSTHFALFDAFLLTSREDPYPLVCLESAARGIPIVCFADAGGMPEFVEHDAGCVVGYLDLAAAAEALVSLATSEPTRTALGQRAAEKVHERCAIEVVAGQVAAVLDRTLESR